MTVPLTCSPNAAIAYDFFLDKGLLDFQSAAIVGNLQQESRIDPAENTGDGGSARGIAQWHGPRWKDLQAFAVQMGLSPWSLDLQLEFIWHELETVPSAGLSKLRATKTLEEAVVVFQDLFERCGDCATPKRISYAKSALFSCPNVTVPLSHRKPPSILAAGFGALLLTAAAGYGALKALRKYK